ncbi:hypothetical protein V6N13_024986 [Hibiscus sabdariffa]|uniref:Uncharacterized protein n=2 Tax=Hibiscus sabdariffa TaxID=183260 RepID=A0ABR2BIK1_9ROSI
MGWMDREGDDLRGTLTNEPYLEKVMDGSNEEIVSLPSQPCGVVDREVASVDPTSPNREQIIVHNGVEQKVLAMSDIVLSFLSPTKRKFVFFYLKERKVAEKHLKKIDCD